MLDRLRLRALLAFAYASMALGCLLIYAPAYSQTPELVGEWRIVVLRGTTTHTTLTAASFLGLEAACREFIAQQPPSTTTWTCQTPRFVARVVAPPAVDCVVSAWSDWTGGAWSACVNGSQSWEEARARTIVTQPSNGGAACPALTETRTVTQACAPPPVNRAPTISCAGVPATGVVGVPYGVSGNGFTPAASDLDGDTLTYSIRNPPPWERYLFSATTGNLSGRPRTVRTHSGIEITATDPGGLSAMCRLPTITVTAAPVEPPPPPPPATGTARISWTPPTQYTDGTPLTDLARYQISYGNAPNAFLHTLDVPSAGAISAEVTGLASGTWYFAVTSFNAAGMESEESAVVSKVVQ